MYCLPVPMRQGIKISHKPYLYGGSLLLAATVAFPPTLNPPLLVSSSQTLNPYLPEEEIEEEVLSPAQKTIQTREFRGEVPVEYVETRDLPPGMSRVIQTGKEGIYREVYEVGHPEGEFANPTQVKSLYTYAIRYPEKQVVLRNSQPIIGEKFNLSQLKIVREFVAEATAYTHTGYRTASGVYPRYGLVAVDPKVIPLGTKMYIEGYGYVVAADTGGAIKGDKVDVFFDTESRCYAWGRRQVKVYVLAPK